MTGKSRDDGPGAQPAEYARRGELREHWRVLVAAVLGNALASTTLTFSTIGIFAAL